MLSNTPSSAALVSGGCVEVVGGEASGVGRLMRPLDGREDSCSNQNNSDDGRGNHDLGAARRTAVWGATC